MAPIEEVVAFKEAYSRNVLVAAKEESRLGRRNKHCLCVLVGVPNWRNGRFNSASPKGSAAFLMTFQHSTFKSNYVLNTLEELTHKIFVVFSDQ